MRRFLNDHPYLYVIVGLIVIWFICHVAAYILAGIYVLICLAMTDYGDETEAHNR